MTHSDRPPSGIDQPQNKARRRLLRALAAAGGIALGSTVHVRHWERPRIEIGHLPVHARLTQVLLWLSGRYRSVEKEVRDPGGHKPFIESEGKVIDGRETALLVRERSETSGQASTLQIGDALGFDLRGEKPFININGTITEGDSNTDIMEGDRRATVAGFPNIKVTLKAQVDAVPGVIEGEYTMGADGGLPGGQPIVYVFEANRL